MADARRILLTTFGSLGDLHPFVALSLELQKRGYHPVLGSIEHHRTAVETAGIEFRRIRTTLLETVDSEFITRLFHPRKGIEYLVRDLVMPALKSAYEDTVEAAKGASLLVAHPLTFATRTAARVLDIPWVTTQLAPMAYVSVFDPPVLPAAEFLSSLRRFGPTVFRCVTALGKWSVRSWSEPYIRFNTERGLTTPKDPMFDEHAPLLELALFSHLLGDKQPDWPPQAVVTGFPFYDAAEAASLPPDLEAFLKDGEPPIVFTLGSSAVLAPGRFYSESATAAHNLGRRAVLLTGTAPENRPTHLPPGVTAFDYAPFSLLFPRAAAIVHQGGVGTTGQAMRAGRPMLVMPYAFDQQDNGARVQRLGIARVVKRSDYTARRVAHELEYLFNTPSVIANASDVGRTVSAETGAAAAVDAIEHKLGHDRLLTRPAPIRE